MYKYFTNPDTWISIIAVCLSIIALFQTQKQIKLSNKQQLFDRRIDKYLLFKALLSLYNGNRHLFVDKDSIYKMVDFQFSMLTNCSALEQMCSAIDKPLHDEDQKILLTKLEMLEKNAVELELLWNSEAGRKAGCFVKQYKELLMSMYKQQILLNHLHKQNTEHPIRLEEFQKRAKESASETNLFDNIEKLDSIYHSIIAEKVEKELIDGIKL